MLGAKYRLEVNVPASIANWNSRATLLGCLTATAILTLFHNFDVYSYAPPVDPLPSIVVRGCKLTYYRAPEHVYPPENLLDPYDSFQKDSRGDLIISPGKTNIFSSFAQCTFQGYVLKTRKGNPIIVFQETPAKRLRHKSNCHGLTFLEGDYWLVGSQVERILIDNDWVAVSQSQASPGDVAVYREAGGRVVHTARVTGRDPAGRLLVDSKNGFEKKLESVRAVDVIPF